MRRRDRPRNSGRRRTGRYRAHHNGATVRRGLYGRTEKIAIRRSRTMFDRLFFHENMRVRKRFHTRRQTPVFRMRTPETVPRKHERMFHMRETRGYTSIRQDAVLRSRPSYIVQGTVRIVPLL